MTLRNSMSMMILLVCTCTGTDSSDSSVEQNNVKSKTKLIYAKCVLINMLKHAKDYDRQGDWLIWWTICNIIFTCVSLKVKESNLTSHFHFHAPYFSGRIQHIQGVAFQYRYRALLPMLHRFFYL